MARGIQVYNGAGYNTVTEDEGKIKVYDGASWFNIKKVQRFDGSAWGTVWEWTDAPPPGPSPGVYTLSPTSYSVIGTTGYAQYNTATYRGFITKVDIQVSWLDAGGYTTEFDVRGRTTNNFYRTIDNVSGEWDGRTITHAISSFDSGAITEFNNGSAYGFNFASPFTMGNMFSNAKLVLTV